MSILRFRSALMILAVVGFSGVCMAETFEEIEKKIETAYKKVESVSGKINMETKVAQAGFEMSQTMTGTIEHLRKGEKLLFRMDADSVNIQKMGDSENKQDVKTLVVSDGDTMYTLSESAAGKQAFKTKAQPDELPWRGTNDESNFKVLPDEKVDGHDAYVIEATPKAAPEGDKSRTLYYCMKETGYPVKFVTYGADGNVMSTMTMTDLKFGDSIAESRFQFTAPEGVQVMDMTGGAPGQ